MHMAATKRCQVCTQVAWLLHYSFPSVYPGCSLQVHKLEKVGGNDEEVRLVGYY